MRGTVKRMHVVAIVAFAVMALLGTHSAFAACIMDAKAKDGTLCQILYAGQTTNAGSVCETVIDTNGDKIGDTLQVTYQTASPWTLTEVHLWVEAELRLMPQTRTGNPIPGQFPYKSGSLSPGTTTYQFFVPLASLVYDCALGDKLYYIAAHAALLNTGTGGSETGWAEGSRFVTKGNWGTYAMTTITCKNCNAFGTRCETAFARSPNPVPEAICFLNILESGTPPTLSFLATPDGSFNRWGWTNKIHLPDNVTYTFDIYAAAGQCDITKGTLVGSLSVVVNGQVIQVEMLINSPYFLNEAHIYIGAEALPKNKQGDYTVAPGQYPEVHNELGNNTSGVTHMLSLPVTVDGDTAYVIVHGVVCGLP